MAFVLREAHPDDLPQLLAVAEHLNSVNLPNDEEVLRKLLDQSKKSFAGQLDVFRREYLFVLEDKSNNKLIGTSMIHAQHGTRRAPHIFFDVIEDERYSETLDRHYQHKVLRIGYNYNGPTEIGGLVLLPKFRRHEAALGKWLSYVRFLYIGLHRDSFRDEVLSELMPPLEKDGSSAVWEAIGRHFTGMSYQEADRISQSNKEFIRSLFPAEPIYLSLFPKEVQDVVGQVGPETKGVEKMLRRIGFQYAERIDPFDGGPHFTARTDEITLVRNTKRGKVDVWDKTPTTQYGLLSVARDHAPHFAATGTPFWMEGKNILVPPEAFELMGLTKGDEVGVLAV